MMGYPSRPNLNSFFRVFSGPRLRVLNSDSTLDCRHPLNGENHCFCCDGEFWDPDLRVNSSLLCLWATSQFCGDERNRTSGSGFWCKFICCMESLQIHLFTACYHYTTPPFTNESTKFLTILRDKEDYWYCSFILELGLRPRWVPDAPLSFANFSPSYLLWDSGSVPSGYLFNYSFIISWADSENRTHVSSLEGWSNSHYTTSASMKPFLWFF